MADEIRIEITGDGDDLKKVVKASEKLVKRFEKVNSAATQRRQNREKRASQQAIKTEQQKNKRLEAMDKRLSRRRARNRLRAMKERIRIAKREAAAEARIRAKNIGRIGKYAKFGVAAVGIGSVAGIIAAGKSIADFQVKLRRMATNAKLTQKEEMKLHQLINKTSIETGASRNLLLETVTTIQEKSGVIITSQERMTKLAQFIRVVGEENAEGLAQTYAALALNFEGAGKDLFKFLEISTVVGNKGNFTLNDLSENGQVLVTAFNRLEDTSESAWGKFNALMQLFAGITGTAANATTAIDEFSRMLASPKKTLKEGFKKAGIEIKTANGGLRDTTDILQDILAWINKGNDARKLGVEEKMIGLLNSAAKKQNDLRDLTVASQNAAEELARQYGAIKTTIDQTAKSFGALFTVLGESLLQDAFQKLSTNLAEFLNNKENIENMTEQFKKMGGALGTIVGFLTKIDQISGGPMKRRSAKYAKAYAALPEENQKRLPPVVDNPLLMDKFEGLMEKEQQKVKASSFAKEGSEPLYIYLQQKMFSGVGTPSIQIKTVHPYLGTSYGSIIAGFNNNIKIPLRRPGG